MKLRNPLVPLAALCLLIGACSLPEGQEPATRMPTDAEVEQYNAMVSPEEHIVCRMETPVSSNIPRRVCRLVRDIEEASDFHREQLRRVLR